MTFKLMEGKALDARLAQVPRKLRDHNAWLQETAMQCLGHAKEHGDTARMGKLIEAFRDRGDGKAHPYMTGLTRWIKANSPIRPKQGHKGVYRLIKPDEDGFVPFNIEAAAETPFYLLNGAGVDTMTTFADVIKLGTNPGAKFEKLLGDGKLDPEIEAATIERMKRAFAASKKAFEVAMGITGEGKAAVESAEARDKARSSKVVAEAA